jgi:hypothetical protein
MRSDSFWARVVQASRPSRPLFKITASSWWTEVLVAAGAQRARSYNTMTFRLPDVAFRVPEEQGGQSLPDLLNQPISVGELLRHLEGIPGIGFSSLVLRPREYSDARIVGDRLRDGRAVVLDLRGMSNADARRMVDFSAGLIFGMRGSIEKLRDKVFILTPPTMSERVSSSMRDALLRAIADPTSRDRLVIVWEGEEPPTPDEEAEIEQFLGVIHGES